MLIHVYVHIADGSITQYLLPDFTEERSIVRYLCRLWMKRETMDIATKKTLADYLDRFVFNGQLFTELQFIELVELGKYSRNTLSVKAELIYDNEELNEYPPIPPKYSFGAKSYAAHRRIRLVKGFLDSKWSKDGDTMESLQSDLAAVSGERVPTVSLAKIHNDGFDMALTGSKKYQEMYEMITNMFQMIEELPEKSDVAAPAINNVSDIRVQKLVDEVTELRAEMETMKNYGKLQLDQKIAIQNMMRGMPPKFIERYKKDFPDEEFLPFDLKTKEEK